MAEARTKILVCHTIRFSVTWAGVGKEREPVLETSDSVLDKFRQNLEASRCLSSRVLLRRDQHAVDQDVEHPGGYSQGDVIILAIEHS